MAIESALSYVIREEQDGFVAVDFDFIDGQDDEIRDWEIVDEYSSTGEESEGDVDDVASDEVSVEDLKALPEYSPEMFVSYRQSIAADGDVIECSRGGQETEDDDEDDEDDDDLCENGEDLHQLFAGEDLKSVPESSPEMIVGDGEFDTAESMEEIISRNYQLYCIDDKVISYRSHRDYDYDYDYDREEEEVDYDLDDELVPYSAKVKFGRERMRKLGKRSCSKSVKSKRLTYNYNKAGCFRGKHGLGLKHSLI